MDNDKIAIYFNGEEPLVFNIAKGTIGSVVGKIDQTAKNGYYVSFADAETKEVVCINAKNVNYIKLAQEKEKPKRRQVEPPTRDEVMEYAKEVGREDLCDTFYNYYDKLKWLDMGGKRVKNWKGKFLVWTTRNRGQAPKEQKDNSKMVGDGVCEI